MENNENTGIEADGTVDGEMEMDGDESESGGIEVVEDDGDDGVETAPSGEAGPTKVRAVPAYEAFVAACRAHGEALGLQVKEQKGFFQFINATTGHKLYVAKQGRSVTRIDTTLPMSALPGISLKLEKPNGRIACHVQADVDAAQLALDTLATYGEKIPAPKRQAKAEAASK